MNILLDTNVLLWYLQNHDLLPEVFKKQILNDENKVFVSMASFWEIAIKNSRGKLKLEGSLEGFFDEVRRVHRFSILTIQDSHLLSLLKLPFHHGDPFDRLIFAQSLAEGMEFLYTDKVFDQYKGV